MRRAGNRGQRGVTILVVLILLSVMLLGGLALSRMAGAGTLVAGNVMMKERALQASEVGINTAYANVRSLSTSQLGSDTGGWYFAAERTPDADGLPSGVDWSDTGAAGPSIDVGGFTVRYVVERICSTAAPADVAGECLLKMVDIPVKDASGLTPPMAQQFRVTVRVTGPKDTRTYVQALVTRG
jgi:type IV pilus assembly protein PilX